MQRLEQRPHHQAHCVALGQAAAVLAHERQEVAPARVLLDEHEGLGLAVPVLRRNARQEAGRAGTRKEGQGVERSAAGAGGVRVAWVGASADGGQAGWLACFTLPRTWNAASRCTTCGCCRLLCMATSRYISCWATSGAWLHRAYTFRTTSVLECMQVACTGGALRPRGGTG